MKAVVVHRGARDFYQVAQALADEGMLERLVTDIYWPAEKKWASAIERAVPNGARRMLRLRHAPELPSRKISLCLGSGLVSFALSKLKQAPFWVQQKTVRWTDDTLGRRAGQIASRCASAMLSYSYYGYSAFSNTASSLPKVLFHMQAHPGSVRRILREQIERYPACAAALHKEWELALPEEEYARLIEEARMAQHWITTCSFAKQTLVENGIPAERTAVIPYGVDLQYYSAGPERERGKGPLKVLFVGTLNQRKGIFDLVEAVKTFSKRDVELIFCGRVVDDLEWMEPVRDRVTLKVNAKFEEVVNAYQEADLFLFPSLAEGFGLVVIEALSCGVPVFSTPATAAGDLVTNGVDGFLFEPGNVEAIRERLDWALQNREQLIDMRGAAREKAALYTWSRFRKNVAAFMRSLNV